MPGALFPGARPAQRLWRTPLAGGRLHPFTDLNRSLLVACMCVCNPREARMKPCSKHQITGCAGTSIACGGIQSQDTWASTHDGPSPPHLAMARCGSSAHSCRPIQNSSCPRMMSASTAAPANTCGCEGARVLSWVWTAGAIHAAPAALALQTALGAQQAPVPLWCLMLPAAQAEAGGGEGDWAGVYSRTARPCLSPYAAAAGGPPLSA